MKKVYIGENAYGYGGPVKMEETGELLLQYRNHLSALGYHPASITNFLCFAKAFLNWLYTQAGVCLRETRACHIQGYHAYLRERPNQHRSGGLSESSIYSAMSSLRLLYAFLEAEGRLSHTNPMNPLSFRAPEQNPYRDVLSRTDIQALYRVSENLLDKAVLSLFYGCGLRKSEGKQLRVRDVHFHTGLLYVRSGKGKKRRAVPMSPGVRAHLEAYLRQGRKPEKRSSLFLLGHRGIPVCSAFLNNRFAAPS